MTCPVSSTPRRIQALSKSFLLTLTTTSSQESLRELLKCDEAKGWGIFVLKASILSLLISVCRRRNLRPPQLLSKQISLVFFLS